MKPTQSAKPIGAAGRDLVAQRRVAEGVRADDEHDRHEGHRQPQHRQVRGQLLERDPALAERRGGDEVEAAPAGLAGERPGQGEDRPERRAQGEERAVLPAHVAAQGAQLRADQGGVAEQVDHRGRDAPDELVDLEARLPGSERRSRWRRPGPRAMPAEQARGDDEGEARVADRLAVDAAEAVQPAPQRDRRDGAAASAPARRRWRS